MYALKCAFRDKSPMLRSASRHSKYSNILPQLRRSMDGQPDLMNNNSCSVLRRRAQLESNRDSTQLILGDFDDKFYRPRYIHDRKFQRTWAELGDIDELEPEPEPEKSQHEEEEDEESEPDGNEPSHEEHWRQSSRFDDVMYDPKPLQDRAVQCTWQEHDEETLEDEPELQNQPAAKQLARREVLLRQHKPQKRITKQRMAMSSYITQMLSNQDENMHNSYENGLRGYRQDKRY